MNEHSGKIPPPRRKPNLTTNNQSGTRTESQPEKQAPAPFEERNQSLSRPFLSSVPALQPKLKVNAPGDRHEQNADKVAGELLRGKAKTSPIAPLTTEPQQISREAIETAESTEMNTSESLLSEEFTDELYGRAGTGQAVPMDILEEITAATGRDFSQVGIHTDAMAARLSALLNAKAFAFGKDIFFGSGFFNPHTLAGRFLLFHELIHTAQQNGAETPTSLQCVALKEGDKKKIDNALAGKLKRKDVRRMLNVLYKYSGEDIRAYWSGQTALTEKFFNALVPEDFLLYPREILATTRALEAQRRDVLAVQSLQALGGKKKKKDLLAGVRGLFLIQQGPQSSGKELMPDVNDREKLLHVVPGKYLVALEHAYMEEQAMVKHLTGEKEANKGKADEAIHHEYADLRGSELQDIEEARRKIRRFIPVEATAGLFLPLKSRKAIKGYEIIDELSPAARAEFIRRHEDLVWIIDWNLPAAYRARKSFGFQQGASGEEGAKDTEFILGDLGNPQMWRGTDPALNSRLLLSLEFVIQAEMYQAAREKIRPFLDRQILRDEREILRMVLIIFTNEGEHLEKKDDIEALTRARIDENADLFRYYGFEGTTWQKPRRVWGREEFSVARIVDHFFRATQFGKQGKQWREAYREARNDARTDAQASDERFRRGKFRKQYKEDHPRSSLLGTLRFLTKDKDELYLNDVSLPEIQKGMGGNVTGVIFSEENRTPEEGQPPEGLLDIYLQPGFLFVKSESLPFESTEILDASSMFRSDGGVFRLLTAAMHWDQQKEDMIKRGQQTSDYTIPYTLEIELEGLEYNNIRMVDEKSTLAFGNVRVSGLKLKITDAFTSPAEYEGYLGLNVLLVTLYKVFDIMYLLMDVIVQAITKTVPDLKLDYGWALSDMLLNRFSRDFNLEVSAEDIQLLNMGSETGPSVRKVSLGQTRIGVGGDIRDHFQAKADRLKANATLNSSDALRVKYYEDLAQNASNLPDEIARLETLLQATNQKDTARIAELSAEIQDLKAASLLLLTMATEDVYVDKYQKGPAVSGADGDPYPIPLGKLEFAAQLVNPGYGASPAQRDDRRYQSVDNRASGHRADLKSRLFRDELIVEAEHLKFGDNPAFEKARAHEDKLPDWLAGTVEMHDEYWLVTLMIPIVMVTSLDGLEMGDQAEAPMLEPYDDTQPPLLMLYNSYVPLRIDWNSTEDQLKKGLVPKRLSIQAWKSEYADASNIRINPLQDKSTSIDLPLPTRMDNIEFKGLIIDIDEDYNFTTNVDNIGFHADAFSTTAILAQVQNMVTSKFSEFSCREVNYGRKKWTEWDQNAPNRYTEYDTHRFGFTSGTRKQSSLQYEGNDISFNLGYLDGKVEMDDEMVLPPGGSAAKPVNVNSGLRARIKMALGDVKAPSVSYGKEGDDIYLFTFKAPEGFKKSWPVKLHNTFADVEYVQRENREDPEKSEKYLLIHELRADRLTSERLILKYKGKKFKLGAKGALEGVAISGVRIDLEDDFDIRLMPRGEVSIEQTELAKLVVLLNKIPNLTTDQIHIMRLKDDNGYVFSVDNLRTGAELNQNDTATIKQYGSKEKEITYQKMDTDVEITGDRGADISGTYMDDGLLSMDVTVPGILLDKLYFHDIKKDLKIETTGDSDINIIDLDVSVQLKLDKNNADKPISYVKIPKMHLGMLHTNGLRFKQGKTEINVPTGKRILIRDIWVVNLEQNFTEDELTFSMNADYTYAAIKAKIQKTFPDLLRLNNELLVDGLSIGKFKDGTIDIEFLSSELYMPFEPVAGTKYNEDEMFFRTEDFQLLFASGQKEVPFFSGGNTHLILQRKDKSLKTYEDNLKYKLMLQNANINNLNVRVDEFMGEVEGGIMEVNLNGKIREELLVEDHSDHLLIQANALDSDSELSDELRSMITLSRANLKTTNLFRLLDANKEHYDPSTEMSDADKQKEIDRDWAQENQPGWLGQHRGKFDFLDGLVPTDEGGGTVKVTILGHTAEIPIERGAKPYTPPRDRTWATLDYKGPSGYVDINKVIDQLRPGIRDYIANDNSFMTLMGKLIRRAIFTPKSGAKQLADNLKATLDGDDYVVETKLIGLLWYPNLHILVPDALSGERLRRSADDRVLVRLADLMDYQLFEAGKPELGPPIKDKGGEAYKDKMDALIKSLLDRPLGIELSNVELDLSAVPHTVGTGPLAALGDDNHRGLLSEFIDPSENGTIKFSLNAGIDQDPYTGPPTFDTNFNKDPYYRDKGWGTADKKYGVNLELDNFEFPGLHIDREIAEGPFRNMELKASKITAQKLVANIEDYQMKNAHVDLENLQIAGFSIKLDKRYQPPIRKKEPHY